MADQRTSPYLILGVPFAASSDEAAKGFARAVRRVRRMDDPPFDLEDLNWAQHEIDHREGVAEHSLDDFRVPADPTAYELPSRTSSIVNSVRSLERRTEPTDPEVIDQLRAEAAVASVLGAVRAAVAGGNVPVLPVSFIIREE